MLDPLTGLDGDYKILNELHHTVGSVTYLARNLHLLRDVTVTVVPVTAPGGRAALTQLSLDTRLVIGLRNANVIPVLEGRWLGRNHFAVVRARVRGSTLAELLASVGVVSLLRTQSTLEQVYPTLVWARENGIGLRHIAPEWVVFQQGSGRALLAFDAPMTPPDSGEEEERPGTSEIRVLGQLGRIMLSGNSDAAEISTPLRDLRPELSANVAAAVDALAAGQWNGEEDVVALLSLLSSAAGVGPDPSTPRSTTTVSPSRGTMSLSAPPIAPPLAHPHADAIAESEADYPAPDSPAQAASPVSDNEDADETGDDSADVERRMRVTAPRRIVSPESGVPHVIPPQPSRTAPLKPGGTVQRAAVRPPDKPQIVVDATPIRTVERIPTPTADKSLSLILEPASARLMTPPSSPATSTIPPSPPLPPGPSPTPQPIPPLFPPPAMPFPPMPVPPSFPPPQYPPALPSSPAEGHDAELTITHIEEPNAPFTAELAPVEPEAEVPAEAEEATDASPDEDASDETPRATRENARHSIASSTAAAEAPPPDEPADLENDEESLPQTVERPIRRTADKPRASQLHAPGKAFDLPASWPMESTAPHAANQAEAEAPENPAPPPMRERTASESEAFVSRTNTDPRGRSPFATPSQPVARTATPASGPALTPPSTPRMTPSAPRSITPPTMPDVRSSLVRSIPVIDDEPVAESETPAAKVRRPRPGRSWSFPVRGVINIIVVAGVVSGGIWGGRRFLENRRAEEAAAVAEKKRADSVDIAEAAKLAPKAEKGVRKRSPADSAAAARAAAAFDPGGGVPGPGLCGSPAPDDQRRCFTTGVQQSDSTLAHVFGALVTTLRKQAHIGAADSDPPIVDRLRSEQRAWVADRDRDCPALDSSPFAGRARTKCFTDRAEKRTKDLQQQLDAIPSGGP